MKSEENWQRVGEVLEKLCKVGLFPAIGYDVNGWEAWAFLDNPIEGIVGRHAKVYAATATEAVEKLLVNVSSSAVEGVYLDGLLDSNPNT